MMNVFKSKIADMITLIDAYVKDEYDIDIFIKEMIEFWKI